jgi:Exo70 exocyst complex subunit
MSSLEARYTRFESGKKRSTQVSTGHSLFSAGVPEANERLREACKHLFMANNICPLYQLLKENSGMNDGAFSDGDSESWEMMRDREFFRAQQKLLSTLETRLKYESSRFVDIIVESSGIMDVMEELEAAGGPTAFETGHDKGKLIKLKFSIFNATMEAWTSHQGEWRISNEFLRGSVKKDLTRKIVPMYTEFYDIYSQIRFSKKHMDQYLKFPPEDVDRIIQGFFR